MSHLLSLKDSAIVKVDVLTLILCDSLVDFGKCCKSCLKVNADFAAKLASVDALINECFNLSELLLIFNFQFEQIRLAEWFLK